MKNVCCTIDCQYNRQAIIFFQSLSYSFSKRFHLGSPVSSQCLETNDGRWIGCAILPPDMKLYVHDALHWADYVTLPSGSCVMQSLSQESCLFHFESVMVVYSAKKKCDDVVIFMYLTDFSDQLGVTVLEPTCQGAWHEWGRSDRNSCSFYIALHSHHEPEECLVKLLRLRVSFFLCNLLFHCNSSSIAQHSIAAIQESNSWLLRNYECETST